MTDVLFVSWNRLAFTRESFTALVENTDWSLVGRLFVHDDSSTDGTAEWLRNAVVLARAALPVGVDVVFDDGRIGGPVAAMNWYLDQPPPVCAACHGTGIKARDYAKGELSEVCRPCDGRGREKATEVFAKIDNDFVVCPGWLNTLTTVLSANPALDVLGVEPWWGNPTLPLVYSGIYRASDPVRHVGGKGLIRRRIFSSCRPQPGGFNGYQGWTQYQEAHTEVTKAWIEPDIACFGLDQLEEGGRWRDLADGYAKQGWGRLWPPYGDPARYTSWWTPRW